MKTPDAEQKTSRPLNPLWIISLFVTLVESISAYAVIQTTGSIQTALTVFVIVFALLVAGAFFLILWKGHSFFMLQQNTDNQFIHKSL